jgi:hypothetical protein
MITKSTKQTNTINASSLGCSADINFMCSLGISIKDLTIVLQSADIRYPFIRIRRIHLTQMSERIIRMIRAIINGYPRSANSGQAL